MKYSLIILIAISLSSCQPNKKEFGTYPIKSPSIKNVTVNDDFWLPKIKTIQETTIPFGFNKCIEEGRLDNFLIAGGKQKGPVKGVMPFDDTDVYKIIEGASYTLISNANPELENYIDSIIRIIKIGQEPDGYLCTWHTINPNKPSAPWVQASGKRWFNVGGHELYNSGHLFEAAAAHYKATGKRNMLDIALKNADLLVSSFGPDKITIPPGHQIVETGLIKLYHITQKRKYLELAKFFLDARGHANSEFMDGQYSQNHLPVTEQDEAVGHAVRAVYMYAGMTDIAAIYKDSSYLNAVNKLWDNVVNKKMYITGGIGSRHDGEAFGENYELPNLTSYNETCASIGDVYWNHRLFLLSGDAKYYDIIERTLYNGLISGISLDGKGFFYPNPLEADCKYDFNRGTKTRQEWFDCSCCPTNLVRFIPAIPELVYALNNEDLFINLFISNNAKLKVNNTHIEVHQETNYPWEGKVRVSINPKHETKFNLKIRIPGWTKNEVTPGELYTYMKSYHSSIGVLLNGKKVSYETSNGYLVITRSWSKGDIIDIELPMHIRRVKTDEKVEENLNKVAFEYGPIVYCAEQMDNKQEVLNFKVDANANFEIEKNNKLLHGVNTIQIKNSTKTELTLIPYFAWSNRGVNEMKVWFLLSNQ